MDQGSVERRRGRRVSFEAPLLIRHVGAGESGPFREQMIKNISLAGVYFETDGEENFAINEVFMTSVSIPESHRREFPFTRLAGPCRVVRVKHLPHQLPNGKKRLGVALEFGDDLTVLTATPPRG